MKSKAELVKWFQLEYPDLVKAMKQCSHHYDRKNLNPYHLEDDVFTHTMMVLDNVNVYYKRWGYLVAVAALLHDIGKPFTREVNDEKKRVSFFGHESVSAFGALDICAKLGLSKEETIKVFKIITLHTEGFKLSHEEFTNRLVNFEEAHLLIDLIEADSNGRYTEVDSKFDAGLIRRRLMGRVNSPKEKTLTMMVGLPASGKSTLTHALTCNRFDTFTVSRDNILMSNSQGSTYDEKWKNADQKEIDRLLQLSIKQSKEHGYNNVYVDMTNLSRKSRRKILNQYSSKSYSKKAIVKLTYMETLNKRLHGRESKTIPPHVLDNMIKSFYLPLYDEGFDEITYVLD